jgi:hypothetical protein
LSDNSSAILDYVSPASGASAIKRAVLTSLYYKIDESVHQYIQREVKHCRHGRFTAASFTLLGHDTARLLARAYSRLLLPRSMRIRNLCPAEAVAYITKETERYHCIHSDNAGRIHHRGSILLQSVDSGRGLRTPKTCRNSMSWLHIGMGSPTLSNLVKQIDQVATLLWRIRLALRF